MLDADDEPVHSLKAVVTESSSIVLTWEKPAGVSSAAIKVCTAQIPVRSWHALQSLKLMCLELQTLNVLVVVVIVLYKVVLSYVSARE